MAPVFPLAAWEAVKPITNTASPAEELCLGGLRRYVGLGRPLLEKKSHC